MPLSRASCGVAKAMRLAIEIDVALIIVEHAGDRLDHGRLAGTVVAGKRHDLAGITSNETLLSACTPPKCFETS